MPRFSLSYSVADIEADFGLSSQERAEVLLRVPAEELEAAMLKGLQDRLQQEARFVSPPPWVKRRER